MYRDLSTVAVSFVLFGGSFFGVLELTKPVPQEKSEPLHEEVVQRIVFPPPAIMPVSRTEVARRRAPDTSEVDARLRKVSCTIRSLDPILRLVYEEGAQGLPVKGRARAGVKHLLSRIVSEEHRGMYRDPDWYYPEFFYKEIVPVLQARLLGEEAPLQPTNLQRELLEITPGESNASAYDALMRRVAHEIHSKEDHLHAERRQMIQEETIAVELE